MIGVLVNETLQGQTVGEGRLFGRPAYGEGGHGHDEARQMQDIDDLLGLINGGAQVAVAQSFLVHQIAERLGVEQGIGGRIDERQEIVIAGLCLTATGPRAGAVEVGTDGEYDGCLGDHRLVEVGGCQLLFQFVGTGYHDAVQLQVAHRLGTAGLGHQTVQQFFTDFFLTVLANSSSCC